MAWRTIPTTVIQEVLRRWQRVYLPKGHFLWQESGFLYRFGGKAYSSFHVAAKSHSVEDSKLMLISGEPAPQVNGPASYADAHLAAISKELEPKLGYHIYLVPVSGFLDEGPDNAVQA
jgi:hypothetical protein